jgi:hypothetical protein
MLVTNLGHMAHIDGPPRGVWSICDMKGSSGEKPLALMQGKAGDVRTLVQEV